MTARRSSFFYRQLNSVLENSSSNIEKSSTEGEQLILNHVAKVEQAISDWRSEYLRTKSEYKELEKYKGNVNVIQYSRCKDVLLSEDLEFLENRLDYPALIGRLETLVAKVEITRVRMRQANINVSEKISALENVIVDLKRKLCQYLLECDEAADLPAFALR